MAAPRCLALTVRPVTYTLCVTVDTMGMMSE